MTFNSSDKIVLKKGKEKPLYQRHHWIFSGAVAYFPKEKEKAGSLLPVYTASGILIGYAFFNPNVSILGRMASFGAAPPIEAIKNHLLKAIQFRKKIFNPSLTNAYRVVHAEGDHLPGLVVDKYADLLVVQILSLGMDRLRSEIFDLLIKELTPAAIYEKSISGSRVQEGLFPKEEWIYGTPLQEVEILENGLKFLVLPTTGQKTGFFLDHRESRKHIGELAKNKKVLNAFSYSGGFSIYALAGGALKVDSVDTSLPALQLAERQVILNQLEPGKHSIVQEDVFSFLNSHPLDYDLIILDPPAFAKKREHTQQAYKGYVELNRLALQKMKSGSFLYSCSCSASIDMPTFQKALFQATEGLQKEVQILDCRRMTADHPVNLYHPETEYLKSFLLYTP